MNDTTTYPGDAEYLGAVAGMQETYGGRAQIRDGKLVATYAVGDRIAWLDEKGQQRRGVVVEVLTETQYHVRSHVPDRGNEHHLVGEEQAVPF